MVMTLAEAVQSWCCLTSGEPVPFRSVSGSELSAPGLREDLPFAVIHSSPDLGLDVDSVRIFMFWLRPHARNGAGLPAGEQINAHIISQPFCNWLQPGVLPLLRPCAQPLNC